MEERKMILEHQQTVDTHARARQFDSGQFWCLILILKLH